MGVTAEVWLRANRGAFGLSFGRFCLRTESFPSKNKLSGKAGKALSLHVCEERPRLGLMPEFKLNLLLPKVYSVTKRSDRERSVQPTGHLWLDSFHSTRQGPGSPCVGGSGSWGWTGLGPRDLHYKRLPGGHSWRC